MSIRKHCTTLDTFQELMVARTEHLETRSCVEITEADSDVKNMIIKELNSKTFKEFFLSSCFGKEEQKVVMKSEKQDYEASSIISLRWYKQETDEADGYYDALILEKDRSTIVEKKVPTKWLEENFHAADLKKVQEFSVTAEGNKKYIMIDPRVTGNKRKGMTPTRKIE